MEPGSRALSGSPPRSRSIPRRLQLLAGSVVLAGPSALAVLLSSRAGCADADRRAGLGRDGRRTPAGRVPPPARGGLRSRRGALLAGRPGGRAFPAGAACCSPVRSRSWRSRHSSPSSSATAGRSRSRRRATTRSRPPPARPRGTSTAVCCTFSGSYRSELWHAAWHDYEANPVLGSGPGTYEQYWNAASPAPAQGSRRAQPLPRGPGRARPARARTAPRRARRAARRRSPRARLSARPGRARGVCGLSRACRRRLGLGDDVRSRSRRSRSRRLSLAAADLRESPPLALAEACAPAGSSPRFSLAVVAFVGVVGASALAAERPGAREGQVRRGANPRRGRRAAGGGGRPTRGASSATSPRSRGTPRPRASTTGRRSRRTRATGSSGTTSRP